MPIFIFLHVLTMFVAVAMAYGPAVLMVGASSRRDVVALRGVMRANAYVMRLVPPAFVLGLAFGVIAIVVHGFDPLAGWLLIAYALFAASVAITTVFTNPWMRSVAAAAEASPATEFSGERRGAIREGLRYVRGRRDLMLVLVIVFLWGTFGMNFAVFISTMTRIVFELGPTQYGVLSSVLTVLSLLFFWISYEEPSHPRRPREDTSL